MHFNLPKPKVGSDGTDHAGMLFYLLSLAWVPLLLLGDAIFFFIFCSSPFYRFIWDLSTDLGYYCSFHGSAAYWSLPWRENVLFFYYFLFGTVESRLTVQTTANCLLLLLPGASFEFLRLICWEITNILSLLSHVLRFLKCSADERDDFCIPYRMRTMCSFSSFWGGFFSDYLQESHTAQTTILLGEKAQLMKL